MNLVFVILATFAFVEADDYILFKTFDLSDEPSIANKVNGIQIDDMSGKTGVGASWSIKNIDVHSFSSNIANAYTKSKVFKFEFPGIAVSVDADVNGKWGVLNYEAGITLNIKDMKVEQFATFGISSGELLMVPVSCEANINSFGMTVNNQSGKNSVFKLFKSLIKQLIREALETKICSALHEELVEFAADDDFFKYVKKFALMP